MSEAPPSQGPWWIQAIVQGGALVILAMVLYLDSQRDMRAIEILGKILERQVETDQRQVEATNALTETLKMMTVGP